MWMREEHKIYTEKWKKNPLEGGVRQPVITETERERQGWTYGQRPLVPNNFLGPGPTLNKTHYTLIPVHRFLYDSPKGSYSSGCQKQSPKDVWLHKGRGCS